MKKARRFQRETRQVIARKDQLLVALPATVRDHLGLVPRLPVYWHNGGAGKVILTASEQRASGRPPKMEDCPACAKYREELDRYRRELREREAATPGQFWRQGYMRALGDLGNFKSDLELALVLLKELVSRRAHESRPGPDTRRKRTRKVETVPGPDQHPPPDPSPSRSGAVTPPRVRIETPILDGRTGPDSSEQGADTSGAQPPGVPLES